MKKKMTLTLSSLMLLMGCSGTSPKLGTENNKLSACPSSPNCVCSYETDEEHGIAPLTFNGDHQATKTALLKILQNDKSAKIISDDEHYIRAEFTSQIFRFVDDVEFYFPVSSSNETIIQVRSASRIGHSDLGANRKRIESIRQQLIN